MREGGRQVLGKSCRYTDPLKAQPSLHTVLLHPRNIQRTYHPHRPYQVGLGTRVSKRLSGGRRVVSWMSQQACHVFMAAGTRKGAGGGEQGAGWPWLAG